MWSDFVVLIMFSTLFAVYGFWILGMYLKYEKANRLYYLIFLVVFIVWIGGMFFPKWFLKFINASSMSAMGQFGDMFGAVNALFFWVSIRWRCYCFNNAETNYERAV